MSIITNNLKLVIALAVAGVLSLGGTVAASTNGWGVDDAPRPQKRGPSVRHGGHYMIFYGGHRRGMRGGMGPGGFRGGK